MKISELIEELQESLDINGDGEVEMDTPFGREPYERVGGFVIDSEGNVTMYTKEAN